MASDLFSSFMLVSYTGDSSTPDTKDDDKRPDNGNENLPATGDNGVVIYVAVLAVSGVLCAYWITRRKKVK